MSLHPHRRAGSSGQRELQWALLVTVATMVMELIAGLISGSLALLADAGHMMTDGLALSVSLFASWIATKPATPEKTYGYYRTEILAALCNGVLLWLLVIWIDVRAVQRLAHPQPIVTGPMLVAATVGLLANLLSSRLLRRASCQNLNIQGARLHVLSDALGSVGVIAAGLAIWLKGWVIADPIASLFISVLIAANSWLLITRSVHVLLEGAPAHLNLTRILEAMREVTGVQDVHDVHVWTITTGLEAMSGHVTVTHLGEGPAIVAALNRLLAERFGVTHTTFQVELGHDTCETTH